MPEHLFYLPSSWVQLFNSRFSPGRVATLRVRFSEAAATLFVLF